MGQIIGPVSFGLPGVSGDRSPRPSGAEGL